MSTFVERVQNCFDSRIRTLGKIKSHSLGADSLTLTALNVLVYAQLEGGMKDLAACVLRDLNNRRLPIGQIKPELIQWRNPSEISRFRSMVDFQMIAQQDPFGAALGRRFKVRGINRRTEMNQMDWDAIRKVYKGFGLDSSNIELMSAKIDQIVEDRNRAAHHGVLPQAAAVMVERHVRENVAVVENVLTDFGIRILPFFEDKLHIR